jgi:hypothetical protein
VDDGQSKTATVRIRFEAFTRAADHLPWSCYLGTRIRITRLREGLETFKAGERKDDAGPQERNGTHDNVLSPG